VGAREMTTDPAQFQKLLKIVSPEIIETLWFLPLPFGKKDPPACKEPKDEKNRLTAQQALDRLKKGMNVGLYCSPTGLLIIDVDMDKDSGELVIPEEQRNTFPKTLTIKTRNGGLQYYYLNNGKFRNAIHTYNGIKAGEIRNDWYYGLAPGSFVKPDDKAGKDATGLYTIINDTPMVSIDTLPACITVKEKDETKPKEEIKIEHTGTWKNDLGMPLYEIRRKDQKLDELLSGAYECGYPSRSEADMAAATKLSFWRFSHSEIAGILREYRPYEKTARQDYLETTINNIPNTGKYDPNYKGNGNGNGTGIKLDLGDIPEHTQRYNKQAKMDLSGLPATNFIMKYVSYASLMTDAYVDYHVAGGFNLLSIAADRKIKMCFAHDTIYPNVWQAIIGDSTVSRKTASVVMMYDKIGKAVFDTTKFLPQSSSPESLIEDLSNNPKEALIRDEAGGFLRELDKPYMQGFKDVLCSLYDNRGFHRKLRTNQRKSSQTDFKVENPFINIYFATTPEVFKEYCNFLDASSGWLVRFLYYTPDYEKAWRGYRKETEVDINLKYGVRECLEQIKRRIEALVDELEYEFSEEAFEYFTKWQQRTEKEAQKARDKNRLRILGRLHTYAIKISMLFLLGDNDNNKIISKKYIEIACKLMEDYFIINSCNIIEDIARDEKHNLQDRVISILKTYGRTSVRDIMRYAHQPKKDLADALDALDENGSYEIIKTKEGKTVYYEMNGFLSSVANVTTVATVASVANVPFVADNKGINATNVTISDKPIADVSDGDIHYTLCDKSDKSDDCDKRDSCDNLKMPFSSFPEIQAFFVPYARMAKPATLTDMGWVSMTAINQLKTKLKMPQEQAERVWQNYCIERSWPYQQVTA